MRELVLASQSPRRKELLEKAGFAFRTLTVEVSEILEKNLKIEDAIQTLARQKAQAALAHPKLSEIQDFILLAADTLVVLNGLPLGKPRDQAEAVEFLTTLSGKTHSVITAICLYDSRDRAFFTEACTTEVEFKSLTAMQIREYVGTGEPMDKAGAYAIQGGAQSFVARVGGDLDNVIGLPVSRVKEIFEEKGWDVRRRE